MKVRTLSLYDLDKAAILSYDIIRHSENITPKCPTSYEGLRSHYEKLINHPYDQVFGCFKHDKLVGVLACIINVNNKQITCVGGPFISKSYRDVGNRFYQFIKGSFASFSLVIDLKDVNAKQREYFDNLINSTLYSVNNIYSIEPFNALALSSKVHLIEEEEIEEFTALNEESKLIYKAEKMLEKKDNFHIYTMKNEENHVAGYCILKVNNDPIKVIDINVLDEYKDKGIENELLNESLSLEGNLNNYVISVPTNDKELISIVENMNSKLKDTIYSYRLDF